MSASRSPRDFPPGLQGGLEHDDEDHRIGETGQQGPEGEGDLDRSHREQGGRRDRPSADRESPRSPKR